MWPDWNLTPRVRLRLAKRPSLHVRKHLWKHPQSCIRLHRRVRRPLRLNLNLDLGPNLNLDLNLNLGHPLFETLSRQSFASSFGSMFGSKFVQLYVWMDPALCRQKLGGGSLWAVEWAAELWSGARPIPYLVVPTTGHSPTLA